MGVRSWSPWWRWTRWALILAFFALLYYLLAWPVEIAPRAWTPRENPDLTGPYVPNDALTHAQLWSLPRDRTRGVGPETIAIGPDGFLYTGLCDAAPGTPPLPNRPAECDLEPPHRGRIVRIDPRGHHHQVEPYAHTGGRPLGLAFDALGRLYVADAVRGLLRVQERGERRVVEAVADCVDSAHPGGQPLYTDSVFISRDGLVWFTCPSQRFGLDRIRADGMETQLTGRLLRFDPSSGEKTVVMDRLAFANGVTMPPSERFVLVSEWYGYRITRLWLTGPKRGTREVFFDNAPGYPDNIVAQDEGTFWVGLVIRRLAMIDALHPFPYLMKVIARMPESLQPQAERYGFLIALDGRGRLKHNLQDPRGHLSQITGAYPAGEFLYLASNSDESIGRVRAPGVSPGARAGPGATAARGGAPALTPDARYPAADEEAP